LRDMVDTPSTPLGFHGVRYQVADVSRSVAFYTQLGFSVKHQQLPAFAAVTLDGLDLLLSGPGASGSRLMPDGTEQLPGGWNRIVLKVADLEGWIAAHKQMRFRNRLEAGPGGKQIQIEDPDGNPVELFEPGRRN